MPVVAQICKYARDDILVPRRAGRSITGPGFLALQGPDRLGGKSLFTLLWKEAVVTDAEGAAFSAL
ncbi:hypothetical protein ColTof4_01408 [Colletotrichum tofieldiae]|nr:hypothetical protein ColTof3_08665 [Colletotrichum tofieldiae]GKT68985.1 hypothetical protein ColTof4_01408 [Colletotrichum tofieldiae]